jgi:serine/threonine protein phosphatase 1
MPAGVRIYAIGDVHGRADLLRHVFAMIDEDLRARPTPRAIQVTLGDYIDRGPDSREVIDLLIARAKQHEMVHLKGNHETYVPAFLADPDMLQRWQTLGGLQTLLSYGIRPSINPSAGERIALARQFRALLPPAHVAFFDTLRLAFAFGDYLFVHAGIRPGIPLELQQEDDLIWIRNEFLQSNDDFGAVVVHGHTPMPEPEIRHNRINIDTGAYATGRLSCLLIESDGYVVM